MAGAKISLTGLEETQRALRKYGQNMSKELHDAVQITAQLIRSDAVRSIQSRSGGGITYEKYNPRRTHVASAPGEAPNTDTGRLVGSVRVDQQEHFADVGTDLQYGKFLEFGTIKMDARPYLNPAMEKNRPGWEKRLKAVSDKAAAKVQK